MFKHFKLLLFCVCFGSIPVSFAAAQELSSFYPVEITNLRKEIMSPEQFFGFKTGEQHLPYESVMAYMNYLDQVSDRILVQVAGMSYERRPLFSMVISSEENISSFGMGGGLYGSDGLADISPNRADFGPDMVVNWLGYSVHGNEASGVNASVIVAWLLAASDGDYVKGILDRSVVLIVPALNPDGVTRYAAWVNSNLSYAVNTDDYNREFREPAPSSRSNHYWFDLNRDWLVVQHPEAKAILRLYHEWQPDIVNDFHEQGNLSGTFFSPGIRSSTNSYIPVQNWDLTEKISEFHRSYMDRIGTLYFSREGYDDFYTGKGGAYPDLFGSIGILYEQPNSRGLNRVRDGAEVTLAASVRNQVFCSFSSLLSSVSLRDELLDYRKRFRERVVSYNKVNEGEAYLFSAGSDPSVVGEFLELLDAHRIEYHEYMDNGGDGGKSYVVPFSQPNISVVMNVFEPQNSFADSTFYDVSAWTVPMAFNIKYSKIKLPVAKGDVREAEVSSTAAESSLAGLLPAKSDYAYLFGMDDFYSYNFLYYLTSKGVLVKASDSPFVFSAGEGGAEVSFGVGAIQIPVRLQPFGSDRLYEIIREYFTGSWNGGRFERGFLPKGRVRVYPVQSARGSEFDLGSSRFKFITMPRVAIVVGQGASYATVGELWQLLDYKFRIPVTLLDRSLINGDVLANYNVVVLTGDFDLEKVAAESLARWARSNTLVAVGNGMQFAVKNNLADIKFRPVRRDVDSALVSYAYGLQNRRFTPFTGIVLESMVDLTHPLAVGLKHNSLPVFKRGSQIVDKVADPYMVFSRIGPEPLLSGYVTPAVLDKVKGTPYVVSQKGLVFFPDSPYFRGYWLGTARTFMNALFYRELL
ncbi:MAG: M14 family zinc carboxypeptidase [Rikenellaceae bacterium]|nr:M14 family zinc carboxypeptidase [Rikenellaceae bacterium]